MNSHSLWQSPTFPSYRIIFHRISIKHIKCDQILPRIFNFSSLRYFYNLSFVVFVLHNFSPNVCIEFGCLKQLSRRKSVEKLREKRGYLCSFFSAYVFAECWRQFAGQKGLKSCHRGHFCIWRKIQNVAVSCAAFWFACIVRKFSHFPSLAISFGRPAAFSFCLPCASHLHFKFSSVVVPAFPDYPPAVFSTFKLWRLLLLLSVALISRPECHAHYLLTSHASFTLEKQALCLMP